MSEQENKSLPMSAEDAAADRVVDAALLWALKGEGPGVVTEAEPEPEIRSSWLAVWGPRLGGLAALFLIATVIVMFMAEQDRKQEREQRARAAASGGLVESALNLDVLVGSSLWPTVTRSEDLDALPESPKSLKIVGFWFGDEKMQEVAQRFPGLEQLRLEESSVGTEGISAIASLQSLRRLDLFNCHELVDEHLERLKSLSGLESLDLSGWIGQVAGLDSSDASHADDRSLVPGSQLTAQGLRALSAFSNLRALHLSGTRLDDDALREILRAAPVLSHLEISHCPVSFRVGEVLREAPALRSLVLEDWRAVSTESIRSLVSNPRLRELRLGMTYYSIEDCEPDEIEGFQGAAGLDRLSLSNLRGSLAGWTAVAAIPGLRHLELRGCRGVDKEALKAIAASPDLETLGLHGNRSSLELPINGSTRAEPEDLRPFVSAAKLRALNISGSPELEDAKTVSDLLASKDEFELRDASGALASLPMVEFRAPLAATTTPGDVGAVLMDSEGRVLRRLSTQIQIPAGKHYQTLVVRLYGADSGGTQVRVLSPRSAVYDIPVPTGVSGFTVVEWPSSPVATLHIGRRIMAIEPLSFEGFDAEKLEVIALHKNLHLGRVLLPPKNGKDTLSVAVPTPADSFRVFLPGYRPMDIAFEQDAQTWVTIDLSKLER